MRKKISSLRSRIERYVIVQYLSGKISPHALLAAINGLKVKYKSSYSGINIYGDSKGNKYVTVPMGFTPVEKYNLAIELKGLRIDYNILLSDKKALEVKLQQKESTIQKLIMEISELKTKIEPKIMKATLNISEVEEKDQINVSLN